MKMIKKAAAMLTIAAMLAPTAALPALADDSNQTTVSPTYDITLRMGNTEQKADAATMETYTTLSDGSISKDFIGAMRFAIPATPNGKIIESVSLKLVSERVKGSSQTRYIYAFAPTGWSAEKINYDDVSNAINAARATNAIASFTPNGQSGKALTDSGINDEYKNIAAWTNNVTIPVSSITANSNFDIIISQDTASSETDAVKFYTKDAAAVTVKDSWTGDGANGTTLSAEYLKPSLTITYVDDPNAVKSATVFSSDDNTTWMLKEAKGDGTATVGSTTISTAGDTATGATATLTSTSTDNSNDIIQIRPVVSSVSLTNGIKYTLSVDYSATITALNSTTNSDPVVYAVLRDMYLDSSNKETADKTSGNKVGVKVETGTGTHSGTITATVTPTVDDAYPEIQLYLRHCQGSVTFSNVTLTKTVAAGVEGSSENFGTKIGFEGDIKGADGTTKATADELATVTEYGFAFINFENPGDKTGETDIRDTAPGENGATGTVGNVTVGWVNSNDSLEKASYGTYVEKVDGATSAGFYAVPYIQTAEGTTWGDVTQAAWDSSTEGASE